MSSEQTERVLKQNRLHLAITLAGLLLVAAGAYIAFMLNGSRIEKIERRVEQVSVQHQI